VAYQARACPGFCGMKRLGVFLLPPGRDANPSQGLQEHRTLSPSQGSNPESNLNLESSALTHQHHHLLQTHSILHTPLRPFSVTEELEVHSLIKSENLPN